MRTSKVVVAALVAVGSASTAGAAGRGAHPAATRNTGATARPPAATLKRSDLSVTAHNDNGSKLYEFVIRNDGQARAPATVLEITLGPPCQRAGVMGQRIVLQRQPIRALDVTTSPSMVFKHSFDIGNYDGNGCELRGEIDADQTATEENEQNNVATIKVRQLPRPDLKLVFKAGNGNFSHQIGVQNVGDAAAPATKLGMSCSSTQQDVVAGNAFWPCDPPGGHAGKTWSWDVPAVAPGQTHYVNFPLSSFNPHYTTWSAFADSMHAALEWDEQNNTLSNH